MTNLLMVGKMSNNSHSTTFDSEPRTSLKQYVYMCVCVCVVCVCVCVCCVSVSVSVCVSVCVT